MAVLGRRARRPAARALALALPLALATLTHGGRVAVKLALLKSDLFPDPVAPPLLWVTPPPRHDPS